MIVTFDREPLGWVHPLYRRRHHVHHPLLSGSGDWNHFVGPALETVNTLNQLLELAQHEPRAIQSLTSLKEEKQRDKFELKMEVQQFAPEELDVKIVDNCVLIEGKHEEKKDEHGFISRHFVRRYQLPDDVKPETVTCNLSSDGVLHISAPRMIEEKPRNERTVSINFTGQPAVADKKEEKADEQPLQEKKET